MAKLRAAEKSWCQAKVWSLIGKRRALSIVSSREPVSTTTISSTRPASDSRQASMKVDSSRTIKAAETRIDMPANVAYYSGLILSEELDDWTKPEPLAVCACTFEIVNPSMEKEATM